MAMLKLFKVAAPTSATAVTTTKNTAVRQAIIGNSGANATSVGDSTLSGTITGITVASGTTLTIGNHNPAMGFDLSELFVLAATGDVYVLCLMF